MPALRALLAHGLRLLACVPLKVRVGATASTLVVALVLWNAFDRQPPRHPSTLMLSTRQVERPAARDAALVRHIQAELKEQGLYAGPIDGVAGPATVSALRDHQRETGLPETGRADADMLASLLARPDAGPAADEAVDGAEARVVPASATLGDAAGDPDADPEVIREVQAALAPRARGIKVDGRMGPRTRDAIRAFQELIGAEPTGRIDADLLMALRGPAAPSGD